MVASPLNLKLEYVPSLSTAMAFCKLVLHLELFNMKYIFNNTVAQRGTEWPNIKKS